MGLLGIGRLNSPTSGWEQVCPLRDDRPDLRIATPETPPFSLRRREGFLPGCHGRGPRPYDRERLPLDRPDVERICDCPFAAPARTRGTPGSG